ncbi:accessory protein regulator protein B [Enterococcus faecalis 13-SD-W-01]|nr:accessory protein regulator protein B [Enterococcus faecalis 13-SD-W-01]
MKEKFVNKIMSILFDTETSTEDLKYIQVKFAIDVLINNVLKLAVVFLFALVTHSLYETGITFLSYICIRRYAYGLHSDSEFACLIWTIAYLWGLPLGFKLLDIQIPFFLMCLILAVCFGLLLRYGSKGTALNPIEPEKRPPLLKKAIGMFVLFAVVSLFFSSYDFATYLILGIVLEICMLLPSVNTLMNFRRISHEKSNH